MQNSAEGYLYGDVMQGPGRTWGKWSIPDTHTDNKFGTADDPVINPDRPIGSTPLAIAGWARMAKVLNERGAADDYSRTRGQVVHLLHQGQTGREGRSDGASRRAGNARVDEEERYKNSRTAASSELINQQGVRKTAATRETAGDHGDWAAAAIANFGLQYPNDTRQKASVSRSPSTWTSAIRALTIHSGCHAKGAPGPGQTA